MTLLVTLWRIGVAVCLVGAALSVAISDQEQFGLFLILAGVLGVEYHLFVKGWQDRAQV